MPSHRGTTSEGEKTAETHVISSTLHHQQQPPPQALLSPTSPSHFPSSLSSPASPPADFRSNRPRPLGSPSTAPPWSPTPDDNLLYPASPAPGTKGVLPPPPPYSEPPSPAYSRDSFAPLVPGPHHEQPAQPTHSPYFSPYSPGLAGNGTDWVPMQPRGDGTLGGLDPVAAARGARRRRIRMLAFCCIPLLLLILAVVLGLTFGVLRSKRDN